MTQCIVWCIWHCVLVFQATEYLLTRTHAHPHNHAHTPTHTNTPTPPHTHTPHTHTHISQPLPVPSSSDPSYVYEMSAASLWIVYRDKVRCGTSPSLPHVISTNVSLRLMLMTCRYPALSRTCSASRSSKSLRLPADSWQASVCDLCDVCRWIQQQSEDPPPPSTLPSDFSTPLLLNVCELLQHTSTTYIHIHMNI